MVRSTLFLAFTSFCFHFAMVLSGVAMVLGLIGFYVFFSPIVFIKKAG